MQDRTNHNLLAERMEADFVSARMGEIADFEARANGDKPHLRQGPARRRAATASRPETDMIAVAEPHTISGSIDVPTSQPASLLDLIMVAGRDVAFDVEKFRCLVQIQREEQDRADARADKQGELEAEASFDAALSAVQGKISVVVANQYNSQTRSRYADYAALDRVIKPVYSPAGFSLSFDEEDSPKPDHVRVICWVTHVAEGARRSHKRKYHADIPADGKGARGGDVMTKTHATKSAFTYGKGIVAANVFNLAIDKDDDGNAASAKQAAAAPTPMPGTINANQATEIRKLLTERSINERVFLNIIRLPSIEHIGVENFERAVNKIKSFRRQS